MWRRAVTCEMRNRSAITAVEAPSPSNCRTSHSRSVRLQPVGVKAREGDLPVEHPLDRVWEPVEAHVLGEVARGTREHGLEQPIPVKLQAQHDHPHPRVEVY